MSDLDLTLSGFLIVLRNRFIFGSFTRDVLGSMYKANLVKCLGLLILVGVLGMRLACDHAGLGWVGYTCL